MPGAVVTGAGSGLGFAIARRLAVRGLSVHLTDIDAESVQTAAAEIGGSSWASALDVRDPQACARVAAETAERAGSLAVWVNNAGILVPGLAHEQSPETHRSMLDVNAVGTYNGTSAALALMVAAGSGHLINIISLAGLVAAPGEVGYAASKHAAIAFTLGSLLDLRRSGIRGVEISAVCPDGVWSPMIADKLEDPHAFPSFSGKMLMPDQVAEMVERVLDHPRPLLTIPRWRGALVRIIDTFPRLAIRLMPLVVSDARRRQRRMKRRVEAGKWPPAPS